MYAKFPPALGCEGRRFTVLSRGKEEAFLVSLLLFLTLFFCLHITLAIKQDLVIMWSTKNFLGQMAGDKMESNATRF